MSTKTSPLNASAAATTTTTTSTAAATTNSATSMVKIKKELPSDEIKEFAENTMNELLGWYGFEGVDRLDLSAKTSRLLQTTSNANNAINQHHHHHHHMEKRRSRSRAATLLQLQQQNEHIRNIANNNNNNNNNNRKSTINCNNFRGGNSSGGGVGGGGGGGGNESTTSDHDTRSSREDDSKSPHSAGKSTMDDKIDFLNCCWCRRPVAENAPEFLTTTDGPRYCSESCFTQSRRASFKKAKTCDWCKHIRHAVSYVDFQDGASQLQFCSDKCLNQYKMQIFCKETQAHLDMNPHLRDQGLEAAAAGNGAGLITPDMWLRNCRSRSASPASTVSVSPGPTVILPAVPMSSPRITPPSGSSNQTGTTTTTTPSTAMPVHKPMISVTPASKLMSKSPGIIQNRQSPKHSRKKRPLRSCVASDMASGMKSNHGVGSRELVGHGNLGKSKSHLSINASNNLRSSPGSHMGVGNASGKSTSQSLSQFAGSSVQDLHMSVPPLSPMLDQPHPHSHTLPHNLPQMTNAGGRGIPPQFFATPPNGQQPPQAPAQFPPTGFAPRPPFLQNPIGVLPRFLGGFAGMQQPHHMLQPDLAGLSALLGTPPPVTVMVPYPIIIPLPIPIPVPLPVMEFYKAYLTPEEREKFKLKEKEKEKDKENQQQQPDEERCDEESAADECSERKTTEIQDSHDEQPLDFTKSKDFIAIDATTQDTKPLSIRSAKSPTPPTLNEEEALSLEPDEPKTSRATPTDTNSCSPTDSKATHCIVRSEEENASSGQTSRGNSANYSEDAEDDPDDAKQKLPKFKITRLQTKRTLIQQTKEYEYSRPLRKRKRIIDCDFQKIALKEAETEEQPPSLDTTRIASATTTTPACNSNPKAYNNKK